MSEYCYINHIPTKNSKFGSLNDADQGENVFKIGRTKQPGNKRLIQYPKGTIEKIKMCVSDSVKCERELIKKYDITFRNRPDYGREYYEGNYKDLEKIFLGIASKFSVDGNIDENINDSLNISNSREKKLYKCEDNKNKQTLFCEVCDFYTNDKYSMNKHKLTSKHKTNLEEKSDSDVVKTVYKCNNCEKYFSTKKTLKYHQNNNCIITKNNTLLKKNSELTNKVKMLERLYYTLSKQ